MQIARSCASVLLAALALSPSTAAGDPDCPIACPAHDNTTTGGAVPQGVTWSLMFQTPTPGSGTLACATCTSCEMSGSVIFNGNQTGVCVRVNLGGIGSSQPLPSYARPGKLSSLCDGSYCVYFDFVSCSTGQSAGFNVLACVVCGCEAR
ncbi:MAG: hypothetical protein JNK02_16315 [Planctomycetes bacterium]|nr:hypothetical protein [Planctomycetota bacterium]